MAKGGGRTFTPVGQTPYPISTTFNRFPEGTMGDIWATNKDPARKTVGARLFTDLQTHTHIHTHTHTYTDSIDYMIVVHL